MPGLRLCIMEDTCGNLWSAAWMAAFAGPETASWAAFLSRHADTPRQRCNDNGGHKVR